LKEEKKTRETRVRCGGFVKDGTHAWSGKCGRTVQTLLGNGREKQKKKKKKWHICLVEVRAIQKQMGIGGKKKKLGGVKRRTKGEFLNRKKRTKGGPQMQVRGGGVEPRGTRNFTKELGNKWFWGAKVQQIKGKQKVTKNCPKTREDQRGKINTMRGH